MAWKRSRVRIPYAPPVIAIQAAGSRLLLLYLDLMKEIFKKIVVIILTIQVKKLRKKHTFKVVGVVGSIGKTSTKLAIAQTLSKTLRVRYQEGNYNDIVTVPLIFFDQPLPSLLNPLAWIKVILNNSKQIKGEYPVDVVVVEIGTDAPGQVIRHSEYLQLDYAVVTSIAPEHMEFFTDLRAVAEEELSVAKYSNQVIYNLDLVAPEFRDLLPQNAINYSLSNSEANYYIANMYSSYDGFEGDIKTDGTTWLHFLQEVFSEVQLYSSLAATVVGKEIGLKATEVLAGLKSIKPVSGRLRRLRGMNSSIIIDDTYNSSPEAVKAALVALYKTDSPQRIAILGSMNELGGASAEAHKSIGNICDPAKLNLLVTIGSEANKYLAPAAENKGCQVKSFENPYDAGEYLQSKIEPGAVILAKGSQNGVFAEEAVKKLLADPDDANKLVRQSEFWLKKKQISFK